jgi:hypothetical protein
MGGNRRQPLFLPGVLRGFVVESDLGRLVAAVLLQVIRENSASGVAIFKEKVASTVQGQYQGRRMGQPTKPCAYRKSH